MDSVTRTTSRFAALALGAGMVMTTAADTPHWEGNWHQIDDDFPDFSYHGDTLKERWERLHRRDGMPWPNAEYVRRWGSAGDDPEAVAETLQQGWRLYHAGDFQRAYDIGTETAPAGNLLAGRAWLTYASHLPEDEDTRAAMLERGVEIMEERMTARDGDIPPWEHAGFALLLGQHSKHVSSTRAVREGIPGQVREHLDKALAEQPDLPSALGTYGGYHVELVDRVGGMLARVTFGASRGEAREYFQRALDKDPNLVMARTEFGEALLRLDKSGNWEEAMEHLERALATDPMDADDELERRRARRIMDRWQEKRDQQPDHELPDGFS